MSSKLFKVQINSDQYFYLSTFILGDQHKAEIIRLDESSLAYTPGEMPLLKFNTKAIEFSVPLEKDSIAALLKKVKTYFSESLNLNVEIIETER
jgi:hypothetical protein